jgi:hypothetical protein
MRLTGTNVLKALALLAFIMPLCTLTLFVERRFEFFDKED